VTGILTKIVVNAVALWVATLVVPDVSLSTGEGLGKTVGSFLVVGAIFGLVNTVIKPVVKLLSLPFIILSLGLFAFVVNALMLEIVDWASNSIGISFDSGPFFWSTLAAAVIISLVSWILNVLVPDDKD
jgi:putative membrane protein